jgi:hypothetical protein
VISKASYLTADQCYPKLPIFLQISAIQSPPFSGFANQFMLQNRRAQRLQTLGSHLKILCARRMTCSKFRNEQPQFKGAHVRSIVTTATWSPAFVHHCYRNLVEDLGLGIRLAARRVSTRTTLALKWIRRTFISGVGFEPTVLRSGRWEAAQTLSSVATIVCCRRSWCAQTWGDRTDVVCIKQGNAEKYREQFSENFHLSTWLF